MECFNDDIEREGLDLESKWKHLGQSHGSLRRFGWLFEG